MNYSIMNDECFMSTAPNCDLPSSNFMFCPPSTLLRKLCEVYKDMNNIKFPSCFQHDEVLDIKRDILESKYLNLQLFCFSSFYSNRFDLKQSFGFHNFSKSNDNYSNKYNNFYTNEKFLAKRNVGETYASSISSHTSSSSVSSFCTNRNKKGKEENLHYNPASSPFSNKKMRINYVFGILRQWQTYGFNFSSSLIRIYILQDVQIEGKKETFFNKNSATKKCFKTKLAKEEEDEKEEDDEDEEDEEENEKEKSKKKKIKFFDVRVLEYDMHLSGMFTSIESNIDGSLILLKSKNACVIVDVPYEIKHRNSKKYLLERRKKKKKRKSNDGYLFNSDQKGKCANTFGESKKEIKAQKGRKKIVVKNGLILMSHKYNRCFNNLEKTKSNLSLQLVKASFHPFSYSSVALLTHEALFTEPDHSKGDMEMRSVFRLFDVSVSTEEPDMEFVIEDNVILKTKEENDVNFFNKSEEHSFFADVGAFSSEEEEEDETKQLKEFLGKKKKNRKINCGRSVDFTFLSNHFYSQEESSNNNFMRKNNFNNNISDFDHNNNNNNTDFFYNYYDNYCADFAYKNCFSMNRNYDNLVCFSLLILTESGAIFVFCPLLPRNIFLPYYFLENLNVFIKQYEFLQNNYFHNNIFESKKANINPSLIVSQKNQNNYMLYRCCTSLLKNSVMQTLDTNTVYVKRINDIYMPQAQLILSDDFFSKNKIKNEKYSCFSSFSLINFFFFFIICRTNRNFSVDFLAMENLPKSKFLFTLTENRNKNQIIKHVNERNVLFFSRLSHTSLSTSLSCLSSTSFYSFPSLNFKQFFGRIEILIPYSFFTNYTMMIYSPFAVYYLECIWLRNLHKILSSGSLKNNFCLKNNKRFLIKPILLLKNDFYEMNMSLQKSEKKMSSATSIAAGVVAICGGNMNDHSKVSRYKKDEYVCLYLQMNSYDGMSEKAVDKEIYLYDFARLVLDAKNQKNEEKLIESGKINETKGNLHNVQVNDLATNKIVLHYYNLTLIDIFNEESCVNKNYNISNNTIINHNNNQMKSFTNKKSKSSLLLDNSLKLIKVLFNESASNSSSFFFKTLIKNKMYQSKSLNDSNFKQHPFICFAQYADSTISVLKDVEQNVLNVLSEQQKFLNTKILDFKQNIKLLKIYLSSAKKKNEEILEKSNLKSEKLKILSKKQEEIELKLKEVHSLIFSFYESNQIFRIQYIFMPKVLKKFSSFVDETFLFFQNILLFNERQFNPNIKCFLQKFMKDVKDQLNIQDNLEERNYFLNKKFIDLYKVVFFYAKQKNDRQNQDFLPLLNSS